MDRLERESKKGNPLVIDLTKLEEEGASSNNSSISSTHDSHTIVMTVIIW